MRNATQFLYTNSARVVAHLSRAIAMKSSHFLCIQNAEFHTQQICFPSNVLIKVLRVIYLPLNLHFTPEQRLEIS